MNRATSTGAGHGERAAHRASSPPRIVTVWALLLACTLAAQQKVPAKPSELAGVEDLIQQNRLFEARTAASDYLKNHPRSVEGYNLLGMIDARQQRFLDAITALQTALKISPASARTHTNLGDVYVAQNNLAQAQPEFESALRIDPADREANFNLGVLLMAKGAPTQAIPHLLRVHPATNETRFHLVRAYFATKRTAEAMRMAEELSAAAPSDVQVHFSLGVLLASEKQYAPAELELEKADALKPDTFEIVYNLGQTQLRAEHYPQAELALNRALKLQPDSADTLYLLAQTAMNQSRALDALDLAVRAHRIAPQNADVIFLMAVISMSQNYFEDAIPLLESGVQIAPHRADLLAALGESYFMAGRIDKAGEAFGKLVELEGSARSYAFLGLSYRNLGRFDEARKYLLQGLKLDPRNVTCLYNLGYIASHQGNNAEAETMLQRALAIKADYPDALIELANLRAAEGKQAEAVELLQKFVQVSKDPGPGYYKLAMIERTLHRTADAERDLNSFKSFSKAASSGPLPYGHLFDYLDTRSKLPAGAQAQLDLADLQSEVARHPDRIEPLYMLTEAYLKAGSLDDARKTLAQLDPLAAGDFRTFTGIGVLLARYRYFDGAIAHFKAALDANPNSEEVRFDLANAYFRKRLFPDALHTLEPVSADCNKDDACLSLMGDIYAHMGDSDRAATIYREAIQRNPDNDQDYLSLAMLQLKDQKIADARKTLAAGQARIPASGKLSWGLGLASVLDGDTTKATSEFERAVDLLPEWPGSYSILGVFYFETGQVSKAREVLSRFKGSSASGSLDIGRIEQTLDQAPETSPAPDAPMAQENRAQLLQFALSLADRTL